MTIISVEQVEALRNETMLFIKVFGFSELYKIHNWLDEICDPQHKRHAQSALGAHEHHHDTRQYWGRKDAQSQYKYVRPETASVWDPTRSQEIPFTPSLGFGQTPEDIKSRYEQSTFVQQLRYNPYTSDVYKGYFKKVRGLPKSEAIHAKKQAISLLPKHLRTEFYHRTETHQPLHFHMGFLFNGHECNLKGERYFFPFDAWTWKQWWNLPYTYAPFVNKIVPLHERHFLPCHSDPKFVSFEVEHYLKPCLFASSIEHYVYPASAEKWGPHIPFHTDGSPKTSHDRALSSISDLRAELKTMGLTSSPTSPITFSGTPPVLGLNPDVTPDGRLIPGYHLIFKSLGLKGLQELINDIKNYTAFFVATFGQTEIPEVKNLVEKIAVKMLELKRNLLHNEVLIGPGSHSITGICLIPSKPLPHGFNVQSDFAAPSALFSDEIKKNIGSAYSKALEERQFLIDKLQYAVPILLLDTFNGRFEQLYNG